MVCCLWSTREDSWYGHQQFRIPSSIASACNRAVCLWVAAQQSQIKRTQCMTGQKMVCRSVFSKKTIGQRFFISGFGLVLWNPKFWSIDPTLCWELKSTLHADSDHGAAPHNKNAILIHLSRKVWVGRSNLWSHAQCSHSRYTQVALPLKMTLDVQLPWAYPETNSPPTGRVSSCLMFNFPEHA